jgi:peptidoglycan/xylan/chitin deacetylase (PgdA/CDA1 family)
LRQETNNKSGVIPVLITWDVDPDRWTTTENRQQALLIALDLCEEFGIRSTFFITANYGHEYPEQIRRMQLLDQEIGCHGLTHSDKEEYDSMSENMQRAYIEEATRKLKNISGAPLLSFRSPRVKISAQTLRLLIEYGYQIDSSICSQRMDLLSSNLINPGWLVAPRRPYNPNVDNPFKRGNLPILEIPISAIVLPFISSSLNVFGLNFMRKLLRILIIESKRTGKPIVYLAHPSEFLPNTRRSENIKLAQITPANIKTHGFLWRNIFFRMDGAAWYQATRELFAFMASFADIRFMTCSDYGEYNGFYES